MKQVYFDNAATTALRAEVIDVMTNVMKNNFGNASSSYNLGRLSKSLVESSRKTIAKLLNVTPGEIIFTSGGTEADNLALISAVRDLGVRHIITTKIEHHAVLHTAEALQKEYGVDISYLKVDEKGRIGLNELESLLEAHENVLVSLMYVNNEIGNVLDVRRVANMCKANNAYFHSDAVQAIGHYNLDLQDVKVDFLAASAHKFHGPKGVGFAYIRKDIGLRPIIFGGEQERGLRAGTESIHNIVGLEKAMSLMYAGLEFEMNYIKDLKVYFINQLEQNIPGITFNGLSNDLENSTYTILNVRLPIAESKAAMLLFQLDLKGIACSKGSACQSGSNQKSHVLSEILDANALNQPSIRFSFSNTNTKAEVDYVVQVLKEFI